MATVVQQVKAAEPARALAHFESRLAFETDCADVWYATRHEQKDFVLLDVRTPALYAAGRRVFATRCGLCASGAMPERDALDWDFNRSSNSLRSQRLQTIVSNLLPLKSRRMISPYCLRIIKATSRCILVISFVASER